MAGILNVHLHQPPKPADLVYLQPRLDPGIQITVGPDLPEPPNYDILVAGRPDRKLILASPKLKALVIPWAGIPAETAELMSAFPNITVHNLHHNAVPVAELALALLLAAAKSIIPIDRALRLDDWTPRYEGGSSLLLAGKTAVVLGYGAVGREIAERCRVLGMYVIGVRRTVPPIPAGVPDELHPVTALQQLLPRADVLLICLPHTDETDHLIGERELGLLPSNALLVNVGRGPIVDEAALYHALQSRRLFGAGLDVWYTYPADPDDRSHTAPSTYPFGKLDNVVLSPHRGGHSDATEQLRMTHLAQLLNAACEGRPLPNQVDLAAGY